MDHPAADRNLLFGLLALQNGLIDQDQLVAAFRAWIRDRTRPLADNLPPARPGCRQAGGGRGAGRAARQEPRWQRPEEPRRHWDRPLDVRRAWPGSITPRSSTPSPSSAPARAQMAIPSAPLAWRQAQARPGATFFHSTHPALPTNRPRAAPRHRPLNRYPPPGRRCPKGG